MPNIQRELQDEASLRGGGGGGSVVDSIRGSLYCLFIEIAFQAMLIAAPGHYSSISSNTGLHLWYK
jgi:hypothetical protein